MTASRLRRGRALALAFCIVALGIAVALVCLLGAPILEAWHLHRFRNGDRTTRLDAARRLSEMGSGAAAPLLVDEIARGMEARPSA
jgi:hypothetical protein